VRAYNDIRRKIQDFEATNNSKIDFFREYTQALIRKIGTVEIIDAENKSVKIETFFANPERAIAKIREDRNLVLPVISIAIDDIEDDALRRRTDAQIEMEKGWNKKSQRAVRIVSVAPKAVKLTFVINLWAKYVEDLNQMLENIQLMFNPALDVKTKFSTTIQAFINQVSDNSSMAVSDREDRVVRKSIVVVVDTYVPNRKYLYTSTGEIESINSEIVAITELC